MHTIHGTDTNMPTAPIPETNVPASPSPASQAMDLTVIGDIRIDDTVATRPEWKRLWKRLFVPCSDDAA